MKIISTLPRKPIPWPPPRATSSKGIHSQRSKVSPTLQQRKAPQLRMSLTHPTTPLRRKIYHHQLVDSETERSGHEPTHPQLRDPPPRGDEPTPLSLHPCRLPWCQLQLQLQFQHSQLHNGHRVGGIILSSPSSRPSMSKTWRLFMATSTGTTKPTKACESATDLTTTLSRLFLSLENLATLLVYSMPSLISL